MLKYVAVATIMAVMAALPKYDDKPYFPHLSGKPAGASDGVLVNFGAGNKSGDVTIRLANNTERHFYLAAPPTIVNGRATVCPMPPRPRYSPSPDLCRWWPSNLKIGTTRVRVFYWRGSRWGQPTFVTRELRALE